MPLKWLHLLLTNPAYLLLWCISWANIRRCLQSYRISNQDHRTCNPEKTSYSPWGDLEALKPVPSNRIPLLWNYHWGHSRCGWNFKFPQRVLERNAALAKSIYAKLIFGWKFSQDCGSNGQILRYQWWMAMPDLIKAMAKGMGWLFLLVEFVFSPDFKIKLWWMLGDLPLRKSI